MIMSVIIGSLIGAMFYIFFDVPTIVAVVYGILGFLISGVVLLLDV